MLGLSKWNIAQKLELKWWQRYLKKKDKQTYLNWKKEYWNNFLNSIERSVSIIETDAVLDAGCGPAGIFTVLNTEKIVAIDPLVEAYEKNLEHFSKQQYPNTDFINVPLEAFRSSILFDKIFCLNAINHVADIEAAHDNLFRHLKENGLLIISIDSHKYSFLKKLFRFIPGDALHPHQYDLKDYRKFITDRNGVILQEVKSKPGNIFDYWVLVVKKANS